MDVLVGLPDCPVLPSLVSVFLTYGAGREKLVGGIYAVTILKSPRCGHGVFMVDRKLPCGFRRSACRTRHEGRQQTIFRVYFRGKWRLDSGAHGGLDMARALPPLLPYPSECSP